jgi:nitrilase
MKVAALQMTTGPDVEANLSEASGLLDEAARRGARIAALPENFAFMGIEDADKRRVAEVEGDGPIQSFLAATARRLGLWIVGGTMPLRGPEDGRVAAACLVYDAEGKRAARYDKIHLFDVDIPGKSEQYRESTHVMPGSRPTTVETPAGRLGLTVCYDVRFPELYRTLAGEGARWFTVVSAFTGPTGRAHWETLLRARAIENLSYVVAPAQSGIHPNGRETYGDSLIVDYWGRVVARLPRGRGCVVAELEPERQDQARAAFPALAHRVL